jgi:hypothetical protein
MADHCGQVPESRLSTLNEQNTIPKNINILKREISQLHGRSLSKTKHPVKLMNVCQQLMAVSKYFSTPV